MNHSGPIIASNGKIDIIDCTVCNYAHQKTLPTQMELDDYYRKDKFYTTHSSDDWFAKNYSEHAKGYWKACYEYESRLLSGKLLDYGCGDGWFIKYYDNESVGIEPSSIARWYSSGIEVYNDVASMPKKYKFDSLRLSIVLEHILNPYDLIYSLKEYMNENHTIQIIVPNEFNSLQNIIRNNYGNDWFVQYPHINYFTRSSAVDFVKKCGYYITDISATFPMELFYILGYKYIGNDKLGRTLHMQRLKLEKKFGYRTFSVYKFLLNKFNYGREIIITGRTNP